MKIKSAEFVKSGTRPAHYPDWDLMEVAFAGRSNVGKSSLINTLIERRNLVKVSRTPGHTRLLNFFVARLGDDREIGLVDLPGYGFAKVPPSEKERWQTMIETFLSERKNLRSLVLVMDIRRGMTPDDRQLLESLAYFGVQPICVFTKADKLSRNKRYSRRRELAKELGFPLEDVLLFSSLANTGKGPLWDRIVETTLRSKAAGAAEDWAPLEEDDEEEEADGELDADDEAQGDER